MSRSILEFVDIRIGEDFYLAGELYAKISYEEAMPISFTGEKRKIQWNQPVSHSETQQ